MWITDCGAVVLSLRSYESAEGSSLKSQTYTSGISPIIGLLIKTAQRSWAEYLLPGRKKSDTELVSMHRFKTAASLKPCLPVSWGSGFPQASAVLFNHSHHLWNANEGEGDIQGTEKCSQTRHHPSVVQGRDKRLHVEDDLFHEKDSLSCMEWLYWKKILPPVPKGVTSQSILNLLNRRGHSTQSYGYTYSPHQMQQANTRALHFFDLLNWT